MAPNKVSDTSRMNATELREQAESLMRQAEALATKEFESTLNFLSDKLAHMGKTKKDAVIHLIKMMKSSETEETLAALLGGSANAKSKERSDLDSAGKPPEVGVSYQLPSGETWMRRGKAGATKKEFAVHAKSTTWDAMKA
jgi:hypothetical protein